MREVNDQRMRAWPAFDREDPRGCSVARRIAAEAIHGLGGKRDEPTSCEDGRSFRNVGTAHGFSLRVSRVETSDGRSRQRARTVSHAPIRSSG